MKIKYKYILFIALIHVVMIGLSFIILKEHKLYFILSETLILVSLVISYVLYKDFVAPVNLLVTGINAIKDEEFNVKFLSTGKYEIDLLVSVYNQMIDKIRHERIQQEEQHYFLEKLIQTSPIGIIVLDFDEHIATLNPKAKEIIGPPEREFIGLSLKDVPQAMADIILRLKNGGTDIYTQAHKTIKIQRSSFIDRGFPHHFIMMEDLTQEILSAEKNAYGKIIRMMAHEVNNSIGAVNSILDTLMQKTDPSLEKSVIQVAIDRNDRLNHFMKNFASVLRVPLPLKEKTDLRSMVVDVCNLLHAYTGQNEILLVKELPPEPMYLLLDRNQMEQVFLNILKNAIESIVDKKANSGSGNYQGQIKVMINAPSSLIRFTDNGLGISSDHAANLFSPFFSTKPNGQGVGLMLVREILNHHAFSYNLYSTKEGLTNFDIFFKESFNQRGS